MSGVLCCGNLVVDVLIHPVDSLVWGATTMVESIEQRLGGNGSNTSYALGKLGARVRTLGMVGCDAGGDFVLERLSGAGVDISSIARSEKATATSTVLVNSAGDRLFLHRLGASAEVDFTREELARQFSAGFSHFHSSSPFGLSRLRFKHRRDSRAGARGRAHHVRRYPLGFEGAVARGPRPLPTAHGHPVRE